MSIFGLSAKLLPDSAHPLFPPVCPARPTRPIPVRKVLTHDVDRFFRIDEFPNAVGRDDHEFVVVGQFVRGDDGFGDDAYAFHGVVAYGAGHGESDLGVVGVEPDAGGEADFRGGRDWRERGDAGRGGWW